MIKVSKGQPSQDLTKKLDVWQKKLNREMIIQKEWKLVRETVKSHSSDDIVKNELFPFSYNKCSYCELKPAGTNSLEVEHYFPKSIYYQFCYDWDNLLPSCQRCNRRKWNHDTLLDPIVNPSKQNPRIFFETDGLRITVKPTCPDPEIAKRSIQILGLNRRVIINERSEIFCQFQINIQTLTELLDDYNISSNPRRKRNLAFSMQELAEELNKLSDPHQVLSWFMQSLISNQSEIFSKIVDIISIERI